MVYSAISDSVGTISQFTHKKHIKLSHLGILTDYQKMITVAYESAMQAGFDDIRFNDASGNYVNYWIESKTDSDTADVWIKNDYLSGDTVITMYYGNAGLSSGSSGSGVFEFFDDFDSLTGWTQQSGTWTVSGSMLKIPSGEGWLRNNNQLSLSTDYEIVYRHNPYTATYGIMHIVKGANSLSHTSGLYCENEAYLQGANKDPRLYIDGTSYYGGGDTVQNTWLKTKMRVQSGNTYVGIYNDSNSLLTSVTQASTTANSTDYFGFRAHGPIDVDWMFVRKYVTSEPSYTIGIEQHQRRVPTFIN